MREMAFLVKRMFYPYELRVSKIAYFFGLRFEKVILASRSSGFFLLKIFSSTVLS